MNESNLNKATNSVLLNGNTSFKVSEDNNKAFLSIDIDAFVDYPLLASEKFLDQSCSNEILTMCLISKGLNSNQSFEASFVIKVLSQTQVRQNPKIQKHALCLIYQIINCNTEPSLVYPLDHFLRHSKRVLLDFFKNGQTEHLHECQIVYSEIWNKIVQKYKMNEHLSLKLISTYSTEIKNLQSSPDFATGLSSLNIIKSILKFLKPSEIFDLAEKMPLLWKNLDKELFASMFKILLPDVLKILKNQPSLDRLTDIIVSYAFDESECRQLATIDIICSQFDNFTKPKQQKLGKLLLEFCKSYDKPSFINYFTKNSPFILVFLMKNQKSETDFCSILMNFVEKLIKESSCTKEHSIKIICEFHAYYRSQAKPLLKHYFYLAEDNSLELRKLILETIPEILSVEPKPDKKIIFKAYHTLTSILNKNLNDELIKIAIKILPSIFTSSYFDKTEILTVVQKIFVKREFESFFEKVVMTINWYVIKSSSGLKEAFYNVLLEIYISHFKKSEDELFTDVGISQNKAFIYNFLVDVIINDLKEDPFFESNVLISIFLKMIAAQNCSKDKITVLMKFRDEFLLFKKNRKIALKIALASFWVLSEACLSAFIVPLFLEFLKENNDKFKVEMAEFLKLVMWMGNLSRLEDFKFFSLVSNIFDNSVR